MSSILKKYILAAVIPVVILISMAILPSVIMSLGEEITLEARINGSHNSFIGKGLAVDYKINLIDRDKFSRELKDNNYKNSKFKDVTAYAVLKNTGKYFTVESVVMNRPKEGLYLKCIIPAYSFYDDGSVSQDNNDIYVNYAINSIFNINKYFTEINGNYDDYNYEAKIKIYKGYAKVEDILKK